MQIYELPAVAAAVSNHEIPVQGADHITSKLSVGQIETYIGSVINRIRYDVSQSLTEAQKKTARQNIGVNFFVMASIAALRLYATIPASDTTCYVIGYYALSRKGGGMFAYDSADTTTADDGGYVIVDAAGGRWKRVDTGSKPNPYEFGAKGDNVTNDLTAFQNCLNYGQANGRGMHIPAANYILNGTLNQKKNCDITGDGMRMSWLTFTGSFTAWFVNPDATYANDNTFWAWRGFGITNNVAEGGTYGFLASVSGTEYLSTWHGRDIYIGAFGTAGMYLNNTGGGIFSGLWSDGWVMNGIKGNTVGDSILFERLTINSTTGDHIGLSFTQIAGARELVFDHLNVTCLGGGAELLNTIGAKLLNSWFELPSYAGDYTGLNVGYVSLVGASFTDVNGCTIQPLASISVTSASALYIASGSGNMIDRCELGNGETDYIKIDIAASLTFIGENNIDIGGGVIVITDDSLTTRNFLYPGRARVYRAVNQTGIVTATFTKVMFDTATENVGSHFNLTTAAFTPKAGRVEFSASVRIEAGVVIDSLVSLVLYKNGVAFKSGEYTHTSSTSPVSVTLPSVSDVANGTDYYELFVYATGAGNKTLFGSAVYSWFECRWLRGN